MIAVIQAGGKGTRLQPYTLALPKPLMPVGDQPVLLILLKWLRRWGIKKTIITTGYLGHLIPVLCSNNNLDMNISYSQEPEPLGTVGGLRLLDSELTETFLTVNGDLLSDLDLRAFCSFHKKYGGLLTVAVTEKNIKVDLGVLECENNLMTTFKEKPNMRFKVSMGIYCMEPDILNLIPNQMPFGFDDLVHEMLDKELPINVYVHNGLWMDIGREEDFIHAQRHFLKDYKSVILGC
jgi:mannose-1-phosphate guanylyltransferase